MFNLDILDKLIAVIVVILALSLFVQSLQTVVKRVFKLKSLQIEQSLAHLFHYALDKTQSLDLQSGLVARSPFLCHILPGRTHPANYDPQVSALYQAVTTEFRRVGRVTSTGKLMLDSISKDDLLRFMTRVPAAEMLTNLYPEIKNTISGVEVQIRELDAAIELLAKQSKVVISADGLAPIKQLLADLSQIFGKDGLNAHLAISDVINLERVDPGKLLVVLAQSQTHINETLEGMTNESKASIAGTALKKTSDALAKIGEGVKSLSKWIVVLRGVVEKTEGWFDTVMQSFDERYARSMRTVTILLSVMVVILLNANIVTVYRDVSTNDARRALILQAADKYRRTQNNPNGTSQAPEEFPPDLEHLYQEGRDVFNKNINDYTALGFEGPAWVRDVPTWSLGQAARTVTGWLITILLLSAGAPFWQDTLETLFGLKHLLRKSGDKSNIAQESGTGQTKP